MLIGGKYPSKGKLYIKLVNPFTYYGCDPYIKNNLKSLSIHIRSFSSYQDVSDTIN